jgi:hypothetical protein
MICSALASGMPERDAEYLVSIWTRTQSRPTRDIMAAGRTFRDRFIECELRLCPV